MHLYCFVSCSMDWSAHQDFLWAVGMRWHSPPCFSVLTRHSPLLNADWLHFILLVSCWYLMLALVYFVGLDSVCTYGNSGLACWKKFPGFWGRMRASCCGAGSPELANSDGSMWNWGDAQGKGKMAWFQDVICNYACIRYLGLKDCESGDIWTPSAFERHIVSGWVVDRIEIRHPEFSRMVDRCWFSH